MIEPLTDKKIKAAKADNKDLYLFDGGGLYLQVCVSSSKLWRIKYRFDGKDKRISIGRYPDMSLKEAGEKLISIRKQAAEGINPSEKRKQDRERKKAEEDLRNTFEYVAREWYGKVKAQWSVRHKQKILSRLERQLFP